MARFRNRPRTFRPVGASDHPTPPRRYSRPPGSATRPAPGRSVTTTMPPRPAIRYSRSSATSTLSRTPDDEPFTPLSLLCGLCGSHRRLRPGAGQPRSPKSRLGPVPRSYKRSPGTRTSALRASERLLAGLSGRSKARNRGIGRADGRPGPADRRPERL